MFETDQRIVETLLAENLQFRELYKKHQELDKKVHKFAIGNLQLSDMALNELKKEKLLAKDRMVGMIEDYRRQQLRAS